MMNGIELHADEDAFEKMVLSVAEGKSDKATIAQFFKNNSGNPRSSSRNNGTPHKTRDWRTINLQVD